MKKLAGIAALAAAAGLFAAPTAQARPVIPYSCTIDYVELSTTGPVLPPATIEVPYRVRCYG